MRALFLISNHFFKTLMVKILILSRKKSVYLEIQLWFFLKLNWGHQIERQPSYPLDYTWSNKIPFLLHLYQRFSLFSWWSTPNVSQIFILQKLLLFVWKFHFVYFDVTFCKEKKLSQNWRWWIDLPDVVVWNYLQRYKIHFRKFTEILN